jgi:hypothetical protein
VRRVAINLGAPGNRKATDGTLWLEHPAVGGPSPRVPVAVQPENVRWFRRHESQVGGDLPWVTASGAEGVRSVVVTLAKEGRAARSYTVRLYFAEPARLGPGERVFDVALQGRTVLRDFDVSKEAGGPGRGVVREFRGVTVGNDLTVTLTLSEGPGPVLCGIEAVAEGW